MQTTDIYTAEQPAPPAEHAPALPGGQTNENAREDIPRTDAPSPHIPKQHGGRFPGKRPLGKENAARKDDIKGDIALRDETAIASLAERAALMHEKVVGARAAAREGKLLVAVITLPVYLGSERDALKEELRETLSEATGQEVAVTFDLGVYRGIRPGMSEEEKTLLFKEAGVD